MYRAYVGVISRCLVSNEDVSLFEGPIRDHAWLALLHKPLSTTEGQQVALVNLGALLKSGAIRSILYTDGQKSGSNPGGKQSFALLCSALLCSALLCSALLFIGGPQAS